MTTKTATTPNGKTIKVEIVRKVQDKVNYSDGYNVAVSREIIDYTTISLLDETGKVIATGKELSKVFPQFDAKAIEAGAVGKLGNVYLRSEMYNAAATLLAEVEAETPKSDEQIAIEAAQAKAAADHDTWYNSPDAVRSRRLEAEMDRSDSDC